MIYQKYILRKRLSILVINKKKNDTLFSPDARENPTIVAFENLRQQKIKRLQRIAGLAPKNYLK